MVGSSLEFLIGSQALVKLTCYNQDRLVREPVDANLGLKVNQSVHFSCIKMFFTAYVICEVLDYSNSKEKAKQL